jgi:ankyrin repeat protein
LSVINYNLFFQRKIMLNLYPYTSREAAFEVLGAPNRQNTELHILAMINDITALGEFLKNPDQVNKIINTGNCFGNTPGHIAAERNHLDFLNTLLKNGANPCATNESGYTPLYLAAKAGNLAIINALLTVAPESIHIRTFLDGTPLHAATENHPNLEVVRRLIAAGVDVNAQEKQMGHTALHYAYRPSITRVSNPKEVGVVLHHAPQVVDYLLNNKADPTKENNHGLTPKQYGEAQAAIATQKEPQGPSSFQAPGLRP